MKNEHTGKNEFVTLTTYVGGTVEIKKPTFISTEKAKEFLIKTLFTLEDKDDYKEEFMKMVEKCVDECIEMKENQEKDKGLMN